LLAVQWRGASRGFTPSIQLESLMSSCHGRAAVWAAVAIAVLTGPAAAIGPIEADWLAAVSGSWTNGTNWSTNPHYPRFNQPNAGDAYAVDVGATGPAYTVTLSEHVEVDSLAVSSATATLALDKSNLRIANNLTLNGTVSLSSSEDLSNSATVQFLSNGGTHTITGTGSIKSAAGRVNGVDFPGNGSLTTAADISIGATAGHGRVGGGVLDSAGTFFSEPGATFEIQARDFTNRGTIDVGGVVTIGNGDAAAWRNQGTIRVRDGGRLILGGTFNVDDLGAVVDEGADFIWLTGILNNVGRTLDLNSLGFTVPLALNGGEIRGGRIVSSNSALDIVNDSVLDKVTLGSNFTIRSLARVFARESLTLDNVTLTMPEGAGLIFEGVTQTLAGTGTIFAPNVPQTSATTDILGSELVIGSGITIRNGTEPWREMTVGFKENRGVIISEASSTQVTITSSATIVNGTQWKNLGVLRATAGTMSLRGTYTTAALGTIEATGGQVLLEGTLNNQGATLMINNPWAVVKLRGRVNGGRVDTADNRTADVRGEFYDVTIAGDAVLNDDTSSSASGGLWAHGSLTFDQGTLTIGPFAELNVNSKLTIGGTGTIFLNGAADRTFLQTYTGAEVTIGSGITVKTGATGGGAISRSTLPVINQGRIVADTRGQTLLVDGALTNTGTLRAANGAILRIDAQPWSNAGVMQVEGGQIVINSSQFTNGPNGQIVGSGDVQMGTATLVNLGLISPGMSAGTLLVRGNLALETESLLRLELGGLGASQFDRIGATGSISLGGGLDIVLLNGFKPALGSQFAVVQGQAVTGSFKSNLWKVGAYEFRVDTTANRVTLTTVAVPEASGIVPGVISVAAGFARRRGDRRRAARTGAAP
jgi:hypothetical protein